MTCEEFLIEMYAQRPGEDVASSQEFADHLRSCGLCSRRFAGIVGQDMAVRRTIHAIEAPPTLEAAILSGLAWERAVSSASKRPRIGSWWHRALIPAAVVVLLVIAVCAHRRGQSQVVIREAEALLRASPPLTIDGGEREQILRWSAQVEPGADSLPDRLNHLQFRGASAVNVDKYRAVLLQMKREKRASLLILNHSQLGTDHIATRRVESGSLAYWSEQQKTYILLFRGNVQELQAYMQSMGITA